MVEIIKGGIKNLIVKINDGSTGTPPDPLDLSTVTEITTCFKNEDDTELMKSLTGGGITVLNPFIGKIQIALTDAETALLAEVDSETLEIAVDLGAGPIKLQISNAYSVIPSIC